VIALRHRIAVCARAFDDGRESGTYTPRIVDATRRTYIKRPVLDGMNFAATRRFVSRAPAFPRRGRVVAALESIRMDFFQLGPTTLHDLQPERRGHARALVAKHAKDRPAALVMPMLYREMERPALLGIRQGLERADFLHEIIIPLTAANEDEVESVQRFFRDLPVRTTILWCEGPEVRDTLDRLADRGFDLRGFTGKGLAVWLGMGAASDENHAIVVHDADIEHYDPKILHRLLLPIVVPEMDFYFAKGY